MNRRFLHPDLQFKRMDIGLIHPVCQSLIKAGQTVAHKIPAKSTAQSFKLDIFRYTMQCVYSGECRFPCAFNKEASAHHIRVSFDNVFRTTYRRAVSEKVALALYAHSRTNAHFLYTMIGVLGKSEKANCLRVCYEKGETFLTATRDVEISETLMVSPGAVLFPSQTEEADVSNTLRMMTDIDLEDAPLFAKALSYRENAMLVRPYAHVVHVNSKVDPDLDKRVAKYTMDRELGITDFHVGVGRLDNKYREKEGKEGLLELGELYDKLNDEFKADKV